MSSIDAFRQMFGSMGLIALTLSLIFGLAALVNFWKRRRFQSPPPPKTGPILMNDPHSGAPVSGLGAAKPETPNPRPPPAAPGRPRDAGRPRNPGARLVHTHAPPCAVSTGTDARPGTRCRLGQNRPAFPSARCPGTGCGSRPNGKAR